MVKPKGYDKDYYHKNPKRKAAIAERRKRVRDENIAFIREIKNCPCTDCGIKYPYYIMQFDHLEDKTAVISSRNTLSWSRKRLEEEISKCEIVCANCHFERTFQRGQWFSS